MMDKKTDYEDFTMGLAIFDMVPVLLFLGSGLIIWSMFGEPLFLAGVLAAFIGGTCKAVWKMIIVRNGKDVQLLTKLFHLLMPGGLVLMLLSAVIEGVDEALNGIPPGETGVLPGFRTAFTTMPSALLFIAGIAGMCLMGYLGAHMDNSARANMIEEAVNAVSQLMILIGTAAVYFALFYHAEAAALGALEGTDAVSVTPTETAWFFDGAGENTALVFYPGGKVEAESYAPLMTAIAEKGTDCWLCRMPLNFALADIDAAQDIRDEHDGEYENWYIGGHSVGGVAASELTAKESGWSGLILLASYPSGAQEIPVLSVYGSEDGVLNMEAYEKAKANGSFPSSTEEYVIKGGCHAGFGSYGVQKGDGRAEISAEEQQKKTAELIDRFVSE